MKNPYELAADILEMNTENNKKIRQKHHQTLSPA